MRRILEEQSIFNFRTRATIIIDTSNLLEHTFIGGRYHPYRMVFVVLGEMKKRKLFLWLSPRTLPLIAFTSYEGP